MIEKQILKQKLQEGKSKRQITKELNSSEPTIRKYIKEYNLDNYYSFDISKNNQRNNKSVNIDYFKQIDTEEKAYIFGFILSDGWISNKILGFTLQSEDVDILDKIKYCMGSKHKISYKKYENKKSQKSLIISSLEIVQDLQKLGITNNKSFEASIPFNCIPNHLIIHVLRGIFDGGGSFSQNRPCIATSSLTLKNDILEWCLRNYSVAPSVIQQGQSYRLYFNKNCFKIISDIYQNNKIVLDRKMKAFEKYYTHRINNQ